MESLLNFKALRYQKKFGFVVIGRILWRIIKKLKLKDLEDLWEELGYKKKTIEELYDSHRGELEAVWITDMESLLKYWARKYNSTFKVSIIGKVLWRSLKRVILKDLEELWEKLGYKEKTNAEFLESHRKELEEVWVTNMESFLKFWRTRYKKTFGHSPIGKVLWRVVQDINRKVLQELWEMLWPEVAIDEINHE